MLHNEQIYKDILKNYILKLSKDGLISVKLAIATLFSKILKNKNSKILYLLF